MPNEKKPKTKCVEYLRHAEYYDMQSTFDELYARSQAGEIFENLMDVILSRENILLAYRKTSQNQTGIPGHWESLVSGIDWYSNVSSRSWNLSAKPGSATIAMDSVQIGRLKMR